MHPQPPVMPTQTIETASETLKRGGLVVFPTETVYGLGADAANPDALARLYSVKGRPTNHPVIVHIGDPAQMAQWASAVPEAAHKLAEAFWPGPMTLILTKAAHVSPAVTGGQETVGLRMPDHPVALALLQAFGGGIAAPSANRFGQLSPTRASDLDPVLVQEIDMVLDGGPCQVGLESTIIDLSGPHPAILRPGMLLAEDIEAVLGQPLGENKHETRAPGDLPSHYAPRTPVRLVSGDTFSSTLKHWMTTGKRLCVLALSRAPESPEDTNIHWISAPADPDAYAYALYANLKKLDSFGGDLILVELPPQGSGWTAIHDRLKRAAAGFEIPENAPRE